jgi:hypothetical protein
MKIEEIDLSDERLLLISLIVSDKVCEEIMPIFQPLQLRSTFSRTVGLWLKEYYQKFKVAPKRSIQTVYNSKKTELRDETDEKAIHDFLAFLSKEYESWEQTNAEYNVAQAKNYLKQLAIEALLEDAATALQRKDTEQAEKLLIEYQKQAAAFSNSTKPLFAKIGELPLTPPQWLVHGLFEKNSLNILFGDPGVGKSFLALDIGASIAAGLPFHSHGTKQGAVLYICGEARGTIARRCNAWAAHNDVELSDIPFYIFNSQPQLLDEASLAPLAKALSNIAEKEHGINLIILDTWNRLQGGDENSTADAAKAIAALDKLREPFEAAALIVHHSGHSEKQRMRGASALNAAADNAFRVELVNGTIVLTATKAKDGQAPLPLAFRLIDEEFGDGLRSAVLEEVSAELLWENGKLTKQTEKVFEILKELLEQEPNTTTASWQQAAEVQGIPRASFYRSKKILLSNGYILLNKGKYQVSNSALKSQSQVSHLKVCETLRLETTQESQNYLQHDTENETTLRLRNSTEYRPYSKAENETENETDETNKKILPINVSAHDTENETTLRLMNEELPAETEAKLLRFRLSIMQRMKQNSRLAAVAGG